jgi:hypothetical protein
VRCSTVQYGEVRWMRRASLGGDFSVACERLRAMGSGHRLSAGGQPSCKLALFFARQRDRRNGLYFQRALSSAGAEAEAEAADSGCGTVATIFSCAHHGYGGRDRQCSMPLEDRTTAGIAPSRETLESCFDAVRDAEVSRPLGTARLAVAQVCAEGWSSGRLSTIDYRLSTIDYRPSLAAEGLPRE